MSHANDRAHPRHGRTTGLAVAIALAVACRSAPPRARRLPDDPAVAAARVRELATSCQGLAQALDEIEASPLPGRTLGGLVDDAVALASPRCDAPATSVRGPGVARQLARARLHDGTPERALAELPAGASPAIALRRAELLDRLGRAGEALAALAPALAAAPDETTRAQARLLEVAVAARQGAAGELARLVAGAPVTERDRLAHRAAADIPSAQVDALVADVPELVVAAGDRIEAVRGPAAARAARERATELVPDQAERWDELGRALAASGARADAVAAWDRASALAPAQPAYHLTPIRALALAGAVDQARQRAAALARTARASGTLDDLITASSGAAAAGDAALALALASEARARRPGDGRLAFLVGQRLAAAGQREAAATTFATLLACGAHGQAWHRHEVAAKLAELDDPALVAAALAAPAPCEPVAPAELAGYVARLRAGAAIDAPSTAGGATSGP